MSSQDRNQGQVISQLEPLPFFILNVLLLGYVDLCMVGAKGILRI